MSSNGDPRDGAPPEGTPRDGDPPDILDDPADDSFASFRQRVRTDWRDWVRMWAPWVVLAVIVGAVSWSFLKPAPPRRVVIGRTTTSRPRTDTITAGLDFHPVPSAKGTWA